MFSNSVNELLNIYNLRHVSPTHRESSVVVGAASHAARPLRIRTPAISCRHFRGACGRGCAPVPNPVWGRGLSERSEFRSPNRRDRGKGTRRATPGRPWFWVLLPKQKDLGARGRTPAFFPSVIEDPASFSSLFCKEGIGEVEAFVGPPASPSRPRNDSRSCPN